MDYTQFIKKWFNNVEQLILLIYHEKLVPNVTFLENEDEKAHHEKAHQKDEKAHQKKFQQKILKFQNLKQSIDYKRNIDLLNLQSLNIENQLQNFKILNFLNKHFIKRYQMEYYLQLNFLHDYFDKKDLNLKFYSLDFQEGPLRQRIKLYKKKNFDSKFFSFLEEEEEEEEAFEEGKGKKGKGKEGFTATEPDEPSDQPSNGPNANVYQNLMEPNEVLKSIYNCKHIEALTSTNKILVITTKKILLYQDDDLAEKNEENYFNQSQAFHIYANEAGYYQILKKKKKKHIKKAHQKKKKKKKKQKKLRFGLNEVQDIYKRKYHLENIGLEIFLKDGFNFLIILENDQLRNVLFQQLLLIIFGYNSKSYLLRNNFQDDDVLLLDDDFIKTNP